MSTREMLNRRVNATASQYAERDGMSLQEALQDSRASRVLGNLITDDDLRKRFLENTIEESDIDNLGVAHRKAVEVIKKTDSVVEFLQDRKRLEHMAAVSEDFRKFYEIAGRQSSLKLLNKDYFDDLSQKNPTAFNKLVASVDSSKRLSSGINSLDQKIRDISDRFELSVKDIEEIIQETEPGERTRRIKNLTSRISKYRIYKRIRVKSNLVRAGSTMDRLAKTNDRNVKNVGTMLDEIVSLDTDLRQKLVEELRNPSQQEPKEPSVQEMRQIMEKMPGAWEEFKLAEYKKKVPNASPVDSERYWTTLTTSGDNAAIQELENYKEAFASQHFPQKTSRRSWIRMAFDAIMDDIISK